MAPETPATTYSDPGSGAAAPATPTSRERGADGQFLPGNRAALTHGLYAAGDVPAEFEHLQTEVRQFVADALVDEGDAAQIPARRLALIEYRARRASRNPRSRSNDAGRDAAPVECRWNFHHKPLAALLRARCLLGARARQNACHADVALVASVLEQGVLASR